MKLCVENEVLKIRQFIKTDLDELLFLKKELYDKWGIDGLNAFAAIKELKPDQEVLTPYQTDKYFEAKKYILENKEKFIKEDEQA